MTTNGIPEPSGSLRRRLSVIIPAFFFVAVCFEPYVFRLRSASIYSDDIERVTQLQIMPLSAMLFNPFNEHMAPLFQIVSWFTWQLSGRRLSHAALAFTLASFLPFVLTLGLLGRVIKRETGSLTTALAMLAVFSLSWLSIETVYWYSASSFMWALLATLAAWLAASSGKKVGPTLIATLASAFAPAFCAIGLLAGPIAALRVVSDPGFRRDEVKGWARAVAPVVGTAFYLALCIAFRYQNVLASSYKSKVDVGQGLLAAVCAPSGTLLPALFGFHARASAGFWVGLEIAATISVALVIAYRSRRSVNRPLLLGGLALIFGGYAVAFIPRVVESGWWVLQTQRYHLFPMLGLVFLLAPIFKRILTRFDANPRRAFWVASVFALVLSALNSGEMRDRARNMRYPDQRRTLAALDRLGAVCVRERITRAQALAALDPIRTVWTPVGPNILTMLAAGVETAVVPAPLVRPTLLAALRPEDRLSVCGGMDATPYLVADRRVDRDDPVSVGRAVNFYNVNEERGSFISKGWPSFIEFTMVGSDDSEPHALSLTRADPTAGGVVEVWWKGDGERWTETRSVRLCPAADTAGTWLLPLDRLPHWNPSEGRRVRLLFHAPGPVALGSPRLIR